MRVKQFTVTKQVFVVLVLALCLLNGCAAPFSSSSSSSKNLYQALGGKVKIEEIVDNFINEIAFDEPTYQFFKNSNMRRFKEKLSEQLCVLADGPCTYSGDSMEQVHTGMNISESEFNKGVDLFINAMDKANIPHTLQNRLLKEMAKTRSQMIYR